MGAGGWLSWRNRRAPRDRMASPTPLSDVQLTLASDLANATLARFRHLGRSRRATPLPTIVSETRVYWTLLLAHHMARGAVAGDFVETGVYRGGTTIAMLRALAEANQTYRWHWACDSFAGLPEAEPQDAICAHKRSGAHGCAVPRAGDLSSNRAAFEENVRQWHTRMALSENLRTVAGWFNTTLPAPGMRAISFLRLDGDAYASTRDALVALYPRVSRGGIVYVDDYGGYGGCAAAVDEYRRANGVTAPLQMIWEPGARHSRKSCCKSTRPCGGA